MYQPAALKKGDKIAMVAPAGRIAPEKVSLAIKKFDEWEFEVILGKYLFAEHNQFAGKDEERRNDLQKMLDDKSIKAIICARGGYGCIRTLQNLDFRSFMESPKWISGFSDITVFHTYLNHVLGVKSLHATMPLNFPENSNEAINTLHDSLTGKIPEYHIKTHVLNRKGNAEGNLFGGNLSILCSLHGTLMEEKSQGKILFIEDLNEQLYHLDRMMMTLKVSGKLAELNGIIVGGMTDMDAGNPDFGKTAYEIVREAIDDYNYPAVFDFPAGHISDNRALLMGGKLKLEAKDTEVVLKWEN